MRPQPRTVGWEDTIHLWSNAAGDEDGRVEALRQVKGEEVGPARHLPLAAHVALQKVT